MYLCKSTWFGSRVSHPYVYNQELYSLHLGFSLGISQFVLHLFGVLCWRGERIIVGLVPNLWLGSFAFIIHLNLKFVIWGLVRRIHNFCLSCVSFVCWPQASLPIGLEVISKMATEASSPSPHPFPPHIPLQMCGRVPSCALATSQCPLPLGRFATLGTLMTQSRGSSVCGIVAEMRQIQTDYRNPVEEKRWHSHSLKGRAPQSTLATFPRGESPDPCLDRLLLA